MVFVLRLVFPTWTVTYGSLEPVLSLACKPCAHMTGHKTKQDAVRHHVNTITSSDNLKILKSHFRLVILKVMKTSTWRIKSKVFKKCMNVARTQVDFCCCCCFYFCWLLIKKIHCVDANARRFVCTNLHLLLYFTPVFKKFLRLNVLFKTFVCHTRMGIQQHIQYNTFSNPYRLRAVFQLFSSL